MPSYDVMPNMELYQPVRVEDALDIASRYADRGWLVGGGQDTYGWLKDRAKSADALIDLSAIDELRGIRETSDGVEIGALTTLTEIAERPAEATFFSACRSGICGRKPANPQHWYPRRQRLAGCALLVLSTRFVVLPSWGQPLLRRHAAGHEPRAFTVRDKPLRGRWRLRHCSGTRRSRRHDGAAFG